MKRIAFRHPAFLRATAAAAMSLVAFIILAVLPCRGAAPNGEKSPDVRQLLEKLAQSPPEPCFAGADQAQDSGDLDPLLFQKVEELVAQELNAPGASQESPRERAEAALKQLERMSAEIDADWPEENRLHFQILDLLPVFVVKMEIGQQAGFVAFGVPPGRDEEPNSVWRAIGHDELFYTRSSRAPWQKLDLYSLQRGPSGNARFLAVLHGGGCAGSYGVTYHAYEWGPEDGDYLEVILQQEGSLGLDDEVPGFHQIGRLQTEGQTITLPYCQFSRIDTWDNPSLCMVDTYDLSQDTVRFLSRTYNRPELVPIAKAIEYAQQRDFPAARAYCVSDDVARRLVRDIPSHFFADGLQVTRTGAGKKHIEMDGWAFDVEKHNGIWLVVGLRED